MQEKIDKVVDAVCLIALFVVPVIFLMLAIQAANPKPIYKEQRTEQNENDS